MMLGLNVNVAKCEITTDDVKVLQNFRNVAPVIRHVDRLDTTSAVQLGAPVGSEQSVEGVLKAIFEELRRLSQENIVDSRP